jgi:DNA-binding MarR family transcriptional regulator
MSARRETATVEVGNGDAGIEEAAELRVILVRLQRQLRARSDNYLTPSQVSVLARVEQSGPLRMGALADAEGTSPATVCRLIDSLAQDGLIERVADPLDGRASLVQASSEGASLLGALRAQGTAALRSAFDDLSVEEQSVIRDALPALQALTDRLQSGTSAPRSPVTAPSTTG